MDITDPDRRLIAALEGGLPLAPDPFRIVADQIGMAEADVIARVQALQGEGLIKRFGLVVRHHELGYRANGMVVWDVPDDAVADLGRCFAAFPFVTLCYQRPRRLPDWPYNLFCMVHGRVREQVLAQVAEMTEACGVAKIPHAVLFSTRRFKQRGAVYFSGSQKMEAAE